MYQSGASGAVSFTRPDAVLVMMINYYDNFNYHYDDAVNLDDDNEDLSDSGSDE